MDGNYFCWPADKEEYIKVSVYNNHSPVSSHMHDFIEIVFFAHGSGLHKYHKTEARLIPGDVFIVLPHEEHSYRIDSKTIIYNCLFYPEVLGDDWKSIKDIIGVQNLLMVEPFYRTEQNRQEILHLNLSEKDYMESVLKKMIREQEDKNSGYRLVLKSYLVILISMLGRIWESQFREDEDFFNEKRNMLADTLRYIDQNFADGLEVRQLASKSYLSPDYFRKVFKEVTGLPPIEYINNMRMSRASKLLEDERIPVARVSEMVGVSDVNYFSRLFKTVFGMSPSEYRKKNK